MFCFECVALAPQVLASRGIHRPVKKAADHAVVILYVEMAVFKKEGGRIAARFLPQSDVIGLMLKDNKFMEQQNKKGRPLRNDRPFGILVPRRGLEPPHPKAHGPEPCASTNSATWAFDQGCCPSQAFNYRVSFLGKASIFHSINLISISS